ncbi:MAG: AraC family transcriptional regulator [Clostridium sp.]|jgi:AraC-like DNA-binding protein|nr:AraC family transcriptional regulator [Clostridium sp.]
MELPEKAAAVSRMQCYIEAHLDEDITLDDLANAAGYSKYHAERIFKELTHRTPMETVRALRLTHAAQTLQSSSNRIIDVALDSGFDSHDGFTRAFSRQFGITPQKYQREMPPVRWFIGNNIETYYILKGECEPMPKLPIERTMIVTAVSRPARKLILQRSVKATCYLTYCEEMGCEWEGLLNSISEKFDTAALLTLPPNLIKSGTGNTAAGVEIPMDYDKPIPDGYEVIDLPPCMMLYFQGAPFEDENDFGHAIGLLWELMDAYNPKLYGWDHAPDIAPYFNFGADAKMGAKMARPVKKM